MGSFPIGFTSRIAGCGTSPIGIIGKGGPCLPGGLPGGPPGGSPGGPPGGDPGHVGGGVGDVGLNPPFKSDCNVVVG